MRTNRFLLPLIVAVALGAASPCFVTAQDAAMSDLFKNMPQGDGSTDGAAAGGEPSSGQVGAATVSPAAWSFSGEQTSTYRLPILRDPLDYSGVHLKPDVENLLRIKGKLGSTRFLSSWRVDLWPLGTPLSSAPGEVLSSGPSDITLTPEDNYVLAGSESLYLQVGYFIDSWGVADGINPTNNVNPVDYTHGLAPESIPSLLLKAVYYPVRALSLEAVFEPYKRGDLFPVDPVSAIPSSLFQTSDITILQLPLDLSTAVYGFKATLYTSAVDLSLTYLYDIDAYYTPEITYVTIADKSLALERTRIHQIGADAKSSLGPFGLWLEACLSLTTDPSGTSYNVRNPSISWTAGTDVSFGPSGTFYLNLQYTGRYILGFDKSFFIDYPDGGPNLTLMMTDPAYAIEYYARALSQPLGDQTEGLLSGIILKCDFPLLNGTWKPSVNAAYYLPALYDTTLETRYGSLLLQPSLTFKPADSTEITLGAQLMYAWKKDVGASTVTIDTADRIGMWNNQSNLYVQVGVKW